MALCGQGEGTCSLCSLVSSSEHRSEYSYLPYSALKRPHRHRLGARPLASCPVKTHQHQVIRQANWLLSSAQLVPQDPQVSQRPPSLVQKRTLPSITKYPAKTMTTGQMLHLPWGARSSPRCCPPKSALKILPRC